MVRRRIPTIALTVAAASVGACTSILGLEPLVVVDDDRESGVADGPNVEGGANEASSREASFADGEVDDVAPCTGAGCPTAVLARPVDYISSFAVSGADVFWITYPLVDGKGTLYRCAKAGCGQSPTILQTAINLPITLTVDDGFAVWHEFVSLTNVLRSCELTDCKGTTKTVGGVQAIDAVLRGSTVHFVETNFPTSGIYSCGRGGCAPGLKLVDASLPAQITMDETAAFVVFTDQPASVRNVRRIPRLGGPTTLIATSTANQITHLTAFGGRAYWVENDSNQMTWALQTRALDGSGTTKKLLAERVDGVAADATGLYVSSRLGGTVRRCKLDDCSSPLSVVSGLPYAQHLGLDDDNVYIATSDPSAANVIVRIAKP